jgi:hypothetical protein
MPGFEDSWPTPLDMLEIMDAVDAQRKTVSFGNRTYSIQYHGKSVFIQNLDDYVPCGWFTEDEFRIYR